MNKSRQQFRLLSLSSYEFHVFSVDYSAGLRCSPPWLRVYGSCNEVVVSFLQIYRDAFSTNPQGLMRVWTCYNSLSCHQWSLILSTAPLRELSGTGSERVSGAWWCLLLLCVIRPLPHMVSHVKSNYPDGMNKMQERPLGHSGHCKTCLGHSFYLHALFCISNVTTISNNTGGNTARLYYSSPPHTVFTAEMCVLRWDFK